ncbi:MAG: hypothetical protein A4E67_02142 [Syntrophaceae bacterium PtaB.Bin038]|jgi:hypothetical protein|nr:MAG: hypothetical protein A4E67_02142 [Syntrophaceae bacterium PtaB.Bin038]
MDEKTVLLVVIALFIGFIVLFISRSGETYGMLKPSADATARYQSSRFAADQDYWFSGPESYPVAIIGVEKRFRFDTAGHWVRIDGEEGLRRLVAGMQSWALQMNRNLGGFEMVDPRGERIGDWYSAPGIQAVIKRTGIDSVEIFPPSSEPVQP